MHHKNSVSEESLTVLHEFGVQKRTRLFSGKETFKFIEKQCIHDVVITEGFTYFSVISYILFMEGESGKALHQAFEHFRPRLATLRRIFHGVRFVLLGEKEPESMTGAADQ